MERVVAKFFARVKAQMREKESAEAIRTTPIAKRPILAYAEDDYTWNQLGPYLEAAMVTYELPVVYVTSDPDDPRVDDHDPQMTVYSIRDTLATFLPKVDSPVFLTTMPDLDSFHIKRPQASTVTYAFHSLNSIHMAYRTGAFDAYDVFFCTGPHHTEELTRYFEQIGKTGYDLREVGYPKLDGIAAAYRTYEKVHPDETTVLIAPSWGTHNVLAADGAGLVGALADSGYRVVVRPHPAFFESIYPDGAKIISDLERQFGDRPNVVFETSIASENSFMEADLMISDWSGAALEYALGTERPVLAIDLPPKVNNPEWEHLGMVPFEDRMRAEIGRVIPPGDAAAAVAAVGELIANAADYQVRLAELRSETVYNPGTSAAAGAAVLKDLVDDAAGSG